MTRSSIFSRPSASFSYMDQISKIGFWAVLGQLDPNPGEPDILGKIRLGQFSPNIVPQHKAKNQENCQSRFLAKLVTNSKLNSEFHYPLYGSYLILLFSNKTIFRKASKFDRNTRKQQKFVQKLPI